MAASPGGVPDAPAGNWVDRRAPARLRPFLRLARIDRPIGSWLLLLPCWWSTALAAGAAGSIRQAPVLLVLFAIGAVAMRGAGSTYNDIVDRDLDAKVARTRNRPLPSGQVSARAAALFAAGLALVGLAVLLQLPRFAIAVGLGSLVVVAAYPFMKRIFSMPQLVLGLAFSWGGLMGWAATFGRLDAPALAIYAAAVFWTIGYDTVYAVQDLEDDPVAGIKSSARLFAGHTALAVSVCFGLAVAAAGLAIAMAGGGVLAWLGLAGFAAHCAWQVRRIDTRDGATALMLFRSNRDAGLILFAGLAADAIVRTL